MRLIYMQTCTLICELSTDGYYRRPCVSTVQLRYEEESHAECRSRLDQSTQSTELLEQRSATLQAEVYSLSGQRSRLTERRYGCRVSLGTDYIGDDSGQRPYRPKWTVWVGSGHASLSAGTAVTPHWAQIHRGQHRSATLQAEVDTEWAAATPYWTQVRLSRLTEHRYIGTAAVSGPTGRSGHWVGNDHASLNTGMAVTPHWAQVGLSRLTGHRYIGDDSGQRPYRPKWTVWVGSGHASLNTGTAVTPHWAQIHRGRQRSVVGVGSCHNSLCTCTTVTTQVRSGQMSHQYNLYLNIVWTILSENCF